jgi:ADP-ribose pyrophosphatase
MSSFTPLGRRRVARTSFLTLERVYHLADDGQWSRRDVVRHPGSVVVAPFDGEAIHFIRQFRAPVGRAVLELPAGKLDVSGEPPEQTAHRELAEELGLRAGRLTRVHAALLSPGFTDELSHIYMAEDLSPVDARPQGPEEEAAERLAIPLGEVRRLLAEGAFEDATTLIGVYAVLDSQMP